MIKIKRSFEAIFVLAAVFGLLAAVFLVTGGRLTNAQSNHYPYPPYPYPEPIRPECSRIKDAYIGPYPEACVYLPAVSSDTEGGPTATPSPPPSPTPSPTPTNTPTPTATPTSNPYP